MCHAYAGLCQLDVCTVVHAFVCICMCLHVFVFVCVAVSVLSDWPRTPVNKMWPMGHELPLKKTRKKKTTFIGHSVLKSGCTVDNKLAPSCLPLQMLRLGFNCGTWVGKQQHYRQNSNARVSGRVVNSSHNTSVYTVDTEPATFAPLPCSH